MCLISLAYKVVPDLQLAVCSNRDEFYARPTAAMEWWPSANILAGRDLQAGGTWLGVSGGGRFAAVTNFRGTFGPDKPLSRGRLVADFLTSGASAADWTKAACQRANHYAGFNLLVFDGNSLYYLNNYQSTATALDPGIYAISNHSLDSPWPKVDYAKQQLRDNLAGHGPAHERLAELTSLLSRRQPYPDSRLPDTGIPHEWEKRLSSAFIISEDYGTRASTGVMVASSGEIAVMENCYELGIVKSSQRFTFQP